MATDDRFLPRIGVVRPPGGVAALAARGPDLAHAVRRSCGRTRSVMRSWLPTVRSSPSSRKTVPKSSALPQRPLHSGSLPLPRKRRWSPASVDPTMAARSRRFTGCHTIHRAGTALRDRLGGPGRWQPRGGGRTVIRAPHDFESSHLRLATPLLVRSGFGWVVSANEHAVWWRKLGSVSTRAALRKHVCVGTTANHPSPTGGLVDLGFAAATVDTVCMRSSQGIYGDGPTALLRRHGVLQRPPLPSSPAHHRARR